MYELGIRMAAQGPVVIMNDNMLPGAPFDIASLRYHRFDRYVEDFSDIGRSDFVRGLAEAIKAAYDASMNRQEQPFFDFGNSTTDGFEGECCYMREFHVTSIDGHEDPLASIFRFDSSELRSRGVVEFVHRPEAMEKTQATISAADLQKKFHQLRPSSLKYRGRYFCESSDYIILELRSDDSAKDRLY